MTQMIVSPSRGIARAAGRNIMYGVSELTAFSARQLWYLIVLVSKLSLLVLRAAFELTIILAIYAARFMRFSAVLLALLPLTLFGRGDGMTRFGVWMVTWFPPTPTDRLTQRAGMILSVLFEDDSIERQWIVEWSHLKFQGNVEWARMAWNLSYGEFPYKPKWLTP